MKGNERALRAYLYENRISPPAAFTDRIDSVCHTIRQSEAQAPSAPAKQARTKRRIPFKRRILLIAIAATLLLLSACAAYAIYWSSTQRAKEYVQSGQVDDDVYDLAARSADEIIAGTSFYFPLDGTAEADGLMLQWRSASYWANDHQMSVCFDASDAKTGDASRLKNLECTLTVGNQSYPAYNKDEDGDGRRELIVWKAEEAANADYQINFTLTDLDLQSGTPMTLTGALYDYDDANHRGDALGSFTLRFAYLEPVEQIEAKRAEIMADILATLQDKQAEQEAALSALPDEMLPLNITQDEYTFHDVTVT